MYDFFIRTLELKKTRISQATHLRLYDDAREELRGIFKLTLKYWSGEVQLVLQHRKEAYLSYALLGLDGELGRTKLVVFSNTRSTV